MPTNYYYVSMICLMFPNEKIIHAMREPMDSCFSCYSRLFN
ncbi:sulfotransferase [Solimicrobium silvestre]